MSTPHPSRERRRLEAAVGAIMASPTLFAGGHSDVVDDAIALLHRATLDAPSLRSLRWLASRWRLRDRLLALQSASPGRAYLQRACAELSLALDAVRPRESSPARRARRALESVARPSVSPHFASVMVIAGNFALGAVAALSALAWIVGLRELPAPLDAWARDGVMGFNPSLDMVSLAVVAFGLNALHGRDLSRAIERQQNTHDARNPTAARNHRSLALRASRVALWLIVAVATAGLLAIAAGWTGQVDKVRQVFRFVVVTAFFALPVLIGSGILLIAGSAWSHVVRATSAAASVMLRRRLRPASVDEAEAVLTWQTTKLGSRPRAARWRIDRAIARWLRGETRRREARSRDAALATALADRFRRGMQVEEAIAVDAPTHLDPGSVYRAPSGDDDGARAAGATDMTDLAIEALLSDPVSGSEFRRDFILATADRASREPDDDAARGLVRAVSERLGRAGLHLTPPELNAAARIASERHGGLRRLQRISGVIVMTDDTAAPPENSPLHRVRVDVHDHRVREMDAVGNEFAARAAR